VAGSKAQKGMCHSRGQWDLQGCDTILSQNDQVQPIFGQVQLNKPSVVARYDVEN